MNRREIIKEYERLILDERSKESDYFALLNQLKNRKFYRYRKCDEETIKALEKDQVLFSSPAYFNDGYDTTGYYDMDLAFQKAAATFHEVERRNDPTLENMIKQSFSMERMRQMNAICCLSSTNKSILMWSLYAASSQGFCLEYDFHQVCVAQHKPYLYSGKADLAAECYLMPVVYSNKRLNIQEIADYFACDFASFALTDQPCSIPANPTLSLRLALVKGKEWAWEREWRLIAQQTPSSRFGPFDGRAAITKRPTSVFLGARIERANKEKLISIFAPKGVPIYKTVMPNAKKYALYFERIL